MRGLEAWTLMGRKKEERKIIIKHLGEANAGDIRLKLLKSIVCGIKESAEEYDGHKAGQNRDICKDKQR